MSRLVINEEFILFKRDMSSALLFVFFMLFHLFSSKPFFFRCFFYLNIVTVGLLLFFSVTRPINCSCLLKDITEGLREWFAQQPIDLWKKLARHHGIDESVLMALG